MAYQAQTCFLSAFGSYQTSICFGLHPVLHGETGITLTEGLEGILAGTLAS